MAEANSARCIYMVNTYTSIDLYNNFSKNWLNAHDESFGWCKYCFVIKIHWVLLKWVSYFMNYGVNIWLGGGTFSVNELKRRYASNAMQLNWMLISIDKVKYSSLETKHWNELLMERKYCFWGNSKRNQYKYYRKFINCSGGKIVWKYLLWTS